jgi:hypothetical protein
MEFVCFFIYFKLSYVIDFFYMYHEAHTQGRNLSFCQTMLPMWDIHDSTHIANKSKQHLYTCSILELEKKNVISTVVSEAVSNLVMGRRCGIILTYCVALTE